MQSLDTKVLAQLCQWLEAGQSVWLCTVIHTWGSAPRRPGSLLASCDGEFVGSLSGGCVEDDLIARLAAGEFSQNSPHYLIYGANETDAERFKLPCGGTLGILIEPLQSQQLTQFKRIVAALQQRKTVTRRCTWPQGPDELIEGSKRMPLKLELQEQQPQQLVHSYGPAAHLFIIGINEVSNHLAQFALAADYRVTVCDPRPELTQKWQVPDAQLVTAMPDDAILTHAADENSAIVAVTHDPRIDDMGLMVAFSTEAFYIGAMGSIASSTKRRERLRQLDVSAKQLQRLHAPVGLEIGSKTPAEIAVSILAELIAARSSATRTET